MTKIALFGCLWTVLSAIGCTQPEETKFIETNVDFAAKQMHQLLNNIGEPDGKNYPRTTDRQGNLVCTSIHDWTPGFFSGGLWYLYELTGDKKWEKQAEKWTWPLESHQYFKGNHDIGFMMYCSYGNAQRLSPQEKYENILVESANSLCTRFYAPVQAIESWDYRKAWDGSEWFYPVIIDNMMNLELLFYASRVTGDRKYYDVAVAHANTTLKYHFRDDHSSYHVVNYDTITGKPLHRQTCQGYSDNSTWSRGQAWAVYGYTMMYRETKNETYLKAAQNFAGYFLGHLPEDLVPLWDFNAGQEGFHPNGNSYATINRDNVRDASAAAIVCSALFELGELSKNKMYTQKAVEMLKSLSSPGYRAPLGENGGFLIMHCTGSLPHKAEIDVPLIYADYYYLEALTRYKRLLMQDKRI